ncbi:hypothetical protein GQ55_1G083600 [Panicum hallii var. hallii]|uniref:Uncharacterized protein n=1 Tax=Panicum hallii var. hallii TaxID=1504633 RepID=A0A2T7F3M1_9POAL|nr:hypothetical protein GQ55_1G083600 [Panicum hallii var. hallii]
MMAQSSAGEMDGKGMMAPILLALVLACLVFPAKCEGGGVERSAAGGLRRQPDQEEMAVAAGSSKIHIVLCFKTACSGPSDNTCYCCQTLAGPARRRPSSSVSASSSTSPSLESGSGLHVSGRQFVI